MSAELNLLPQPQEVTFSGGMLNLERVGQIALNTARPADLLFTARATSIGTWRLHHLQNLVTGRRRLRPSDS